MKNKELLLLPAVIAISIAGPMVKWSLNEGASPVMIAFGRMLLSGLILLPVATGRGEIDRLKNMTCTDRRLTIASAILLALHYACWMTSLSFASTFVSTALVCTQPLFVAFLSGVLLHEPILRESIPGAVVAVLGAVMIGVLSMKGEEGSLAGDLLALAGAAFIAGHWLCGRAVRRHVEGTGYTCMVYLMTAACLLAMSPVMGMSMPLRSLGGIVTLSLVCTLGGHAVLTWLLGYVSADVVSFALLGEPIGAALWAMLLFGEQVPMPLVVGGSLVIAGLVLYMAGQVQGRRKARRLAK